MRPRVAKELPPGIRTPDRLPSNCFCRLHAHWALECHAFNFNTFCIVLIQLSLQVFYIPFFLPLCLVGLPIQVLFERTCGFCLQAEPYRYPWQREGGFWYNWHMRHIRKIPSHSSNRFASAAGDADAQPHERDVPLLKPNDGTVPSSLPAHHRPLHV